jgi:DNA-binding transcriptional ArsR family regulator
MAAYRTGKARRAELGFVLQAIADPRRRRILDLLTEQDMPVGRIAERFNISRPAVIKHLRVLRSANLISVRRRGRERIQCLNARPLKSVDAWISRFEALWDEHLQRLKQQVESDL